MKIKRYMCALVLTSVLSMSAAQAANEFVFTSPPRGTPENEAKAYAPIAKILSEVTGKNVVYRHPGNWLTYQENMRKGVYDVIFDGPHFVSWRMKKIQHDPLVTLPGQLVFVTYVKADNSKITNVNDLRGRTVCALAPPNLATLTLYSMFDNPIRQPLIIEVKSFKKGFEDVSKGRCVAGVVRDKLFNKLNKNKKAKVIFQSEGVANQTFSVGPRFTADDKAKITDALLAPNTKEQMKAFHERFNKGGKPLLRAKREKYENLYILLKDVWGFGD